jgi:hypothetical protein
MILPFTLEEFLAVFVRYNQAIWPTQVVAYALGVAAVVLAFRHRSYSGRTISGILATFWLVTGALYHLTFFRAISPAATIFGALFIVQAFVFVWIGVARGTLTFTPDRGLRSLIGVFFVLYSMVLYPLLGFAFGHVYPAAPVFGVAPCPVTIFTFGLLLWSGARTPKWVMAVPLLWAAIGLAASVSLGMHEDLGLVVAGVTTATLLLSRHTAHQSIGHPQGLAA